MNEPMIARVFFYLLICFIVPTTLFQLSFTLPISAAAEDNGAALAVIRTELEHIRADAPRHEETRGVSPALTTVKHQLRDWVESQLGELPSNRNGEDGAELVLAMRLNEELERARLLRKAEVVFPQDWSGVGFLAPVHLEYRWRQTYLVLQTAVEVQCGFDESAYLYGWEDGHWKRLWESEQNTYTEKGYTVQYIRAVQVSPPFRNESPYVLTLGTEPWCASNWHNAYIRLWSVDWSGQGTRLLLDQTEVAYLGAHDIPILGSVSDDGALIEYRAGSFDPAIHSSTTQSKATKLSVLIPSLSAHEISWKSGLSSRGGKAGFGHSPRRVRL